MMFDDGRPYAYDRDGSPITFEQWARLRWTDDEPDAWRTGYERIALDHVGDVSVSTVWLGLDHGHGLTSAPLIFETMVFGGPFDEQCWRYATEDEARAGHANVVALVRLSAEHCTS